MPEQVAEVKYEVRLQHDYDRIVRLAISEAIDLWAQEVQNRIRMGIWSKWIPMYKPELYGGTPSAYRGGGMGIGGGYLRSQGYAEKGSVGGQFQAKIYWKTPYVKHLVEPSSRMRTRTGKSYKKRAMSRFGKRARLPGTTLNWREKIKPLAYALLKTYIRDKLIEFGIPREDIHFGPGGITPGRIEQREL